MDRRSAGFGSLRVFVHRASPDVIRLAAENGGQRSFVKDVGPAHVAAQDRDRAMALSNTDRLAGGGSAGKRFAQFLRLKQDTKRRRRADMSTATIRLLAPMRPVALTEDQPKAIRLRDATHNVVATTEDALAVLLAVFVRNECGRRAATDIDCTRAGALLFRDLNSGFPSD